MTDMRISQFEPTDIGYISYKFGKFEICLEPCLNGFCVAIYDNKQNLLEPKKCTKLTLKPDQLSNVVIHRNSGEVHDNYRVVAIPKALAIANKLYKKYKNQK